MFTTNFVHIFHSVKVCFNIILTVYFCLFVFCIELVTTFVKQLFKTIKNTQTMQKTLVQISTQIFENKSFYNGGNSWKPKGELIFNLYAEADDFMYAEENCIEAIKDMLKEQSNEAERFEYIGHELIFHEPISLNSDDFQSKISAIFQQNK